MHQLTSALVFALVVSVTPASAQADDRAAVRQAAQDYVTALYEAKPDLIVRSVAPDLTKHGFMRQQDGSVRRGRMTYDELVALAGRWNADGKRDVSINEVIVGEVYDLTATAMVRAQWGIDHMQLAKLDGQWKIVNIVWQTHPPAK